MPQCVCNSSVLSLIFTILSRLLRVSQEPALLGQIEHADIAMRDETEYKAFVEDVLSPCVVQLAVAVRGASYLRDVFFIQYPTGIAPVSLASFAFSGVERCGSGGTKYRGGSMPDLLVSILFNLTGTIKLMDFSCILSIQ